jgi:hypothetical protein
MKKRSLLWLLILWPLALYKFMRRRGVSQRWAVGVPAGLVVALILIIVVTAGGGSGSTPSAAAKGTPSKVGKKTQKPRVKRRPKAKASFVLVVRQSSCQENPSQAYVNCSIGVRNRGGTAGVPNVWVLYRYNDSGESVDSYQDSVDRGDMKSDPIPPHTLGYIYFSHPYKATDHDVIQAAASLDENAKSWPYIRVADPGDTSWPD